MNVMSGMKIVVLITYINFHVLIFNKIKLNAFSTNKINYNVKVMIEK